MKSRLLSTTLAIALGFGLFGAAPAEAAAKARAGASGVKARSGAIHKGKKAVHTRKKKSHKKRSARVRHSGKAVAGKAHSKSALRSVSGGDAHPI